MTPPDRPWATPETDECPVADTLRLLKGKHGPKVLHCLMSGEMHFLELHRTLMTVSRKVLAAQLLDFEQSGLIVRIEKPETRRRVGYSLTVKGQALCSILSQLYAWSSDFTQVANPKLTAKHDGAT
ncbi:helix-turn-helix domain-containing protein [Ruegeria sp. EL01]|jgi:DNA-binding HxlR family transcriptional regulator|uniref:winged helix-turn-helix transcriptional regulator n=1 Tax=Ruegeria sp. EL01 TaxID=2107578 RepID=UPI000EA80385|nr:helix-turn-helix domain-containing protein [Ruegeria sp. EL01]